MYLVSMYEKVVLADTHYSDVIMGSMASQITSLAVYSGADQRKHQRSASLHGLCTGNSSITREFPAQMSNNAEMFPFHDVIIPSPAYYSSLRSPLLLLRSAELCHKCIWIRTTTKSENGGINISGMPCCWEVVFRFVLLWRWLMFSRQFVLPVTLTSQMPDWYMML